MPTINYANYKLCYALNDKYLRIMILTVNCENKTG